ncbi:MAG: hypothetical protein MUO26_05270 [Methanotrichaceae archaeon]|nr:hypothetical protein [Methanotrichaceae archaeon]
MGRADRLITIIIATFADALHPQEIAGSSIFRLVHDRSIICQPCNDAAKVRQNLIHSVIRPLFSGCN